MELLFSHKSDKNEISDAIVVNANVSVLHLADLRLDVRCSRSGSAAVKK